jgi:hypothetical protein
MARQLRQEGDLLVKAPVDRIHQLFVQFAAHH